MEKIRTKLRLRKQFVLALPIMLILTILTVTVIAANKHSYSASVEEPVKKMSNQVFEGDSILSTNEYVQRYREFKENRQKENTVVYYASKFKLKEDKVLEIAKKLTNNFTSEKFLKTNVIGNDKVINSLGSFDSFEAGVAYFVRDIYRNPKRYGTTSDAIIASKTVDKVTNIKKGTIYMSNGLTFEQYYGKIADMFGIDKSLALAMCYHESGRMTSGLARNKNNIGGMRGGSGWMSFPTLEAGVIAHVLTIKSISERNGFNIADPDGLMKFSGVYVHGNVNSPSEDWVNKVMSFKRKIDSKDVFTIK